MAITRPDSTGITHRGRVLDSVLGNTSYMASGYKTLTELFDAVRQDASKDISIIFDTPFVVDDRNARVTLSLSDKDSVTIKGLNLEDRTQYTSAWDVWRLFDFTNVGRVDIDASVTSTLEFVGGDKQGFYVARIIGADIVNFNAKVSRCFYGIHAENVKVLNVNSVNSDTRYPVSMIKCGIINVKANNNGCRRDFFLIDGCDSARFDINAIDTQQGSPIKHYFQPGRMSHETCNVNIKYKYRSTGRYTLPDRVAPIWLDWAWDSKNNELIGKAIMRNIHIDYDVEGGTWGSVIGTSKLIDESVGDTTARGYTMQNITISGRIDLGGGWRGTGYVFNFHTGPNWKSDDFVGSFKLQDLVIRKKNGGDVILNTQQLESAIVAAQAIQLIRVTAPEMVPDGSSSYGDAVLFDSVLMKEYTSLKASKTSNNTLESTIFVDKGASDSNIIKIGKMNNYRTMSMLSINIIANSPKSGVGSAYCGRMDWLLGQSTSAGVTAGEGAVTQTFTKGTQMTPSLSCDAEGNITFKAGGWESLEANIKLDVSMTYSRWGGGVNNKMKGMVFNPFTLY